MFKRKEIKKNGKLIVLIEDEIDTTTYVAKAFNEYSPIECVPFFRSDPFIEWLNRRIKANEELPCLYVIDILLNNGKTGVQLARELRNDYKIQSDIIIETGCSEVDEDYIDAMDFINNDEFNCGLLHKPFGISDIGTYIHNELHIDLPESFLNFE